MNKYLSLNPYTIDKYSDGYPAAWVYEDNGGLCVCIEPGRNTNAVIATIPWRKVRAALKRKDKNGVT